MARRVHLVALSLGTAIACGRNPLTPLPEDLVDAAADASNADGDIGDGSTDANAGDASSDAGADVDATTGCAAAMPGAPANDPFRRVRTTADLPDDVAAEYQVHLLYVEPSDRDSTTRLDEDGSLRRSVTAFNTWLAARTGGPRLRFDTCGGVLDVTHVKLGGQFTEAALAQGTTLAPNGPVYLRDRLEAELKKSFADSNKIYLVYYDGLAIGHCGGGPFPPSLVGRFPAIYIGGIWSSSFLTVPAGAGVSTLTVYDPVQTGLPGGSYAAKLGNESVTVTGVSATTVSLAAPLASMHPSGEMLVADSRPQDCRLNAFSSDGVALGYTDYSGAHELMHTLGIVSTAAKFFSHTAAPGHLTEASAGGTNDLMYQGSQPWSCSFNKPNAQESLCVLDPAHENYFMVAPDSGAVDLAKSAFLDPTPANPTLPAGW